MWTFTTTGFYSAVEHRDNPDLLLVRARDEESLAPLAALADQAVQFTPDADYAFRVIVSKQDYAQWLMSQVMGIDYPNFKSRAHTVRGEAFVHALHDVWEVMFKFQRQLLQSKAGR